MTLQELAKRPAIERYKYLDNFWWEGEGLLANLLPDGKEGKDLYNRFAVMRYDIHDLLLHEGLVKGEIKHQAEEGFNGKGPTHF